MLKFIQISDMPNMVYVLPKMIDDRIEASYYKKQYLDVDEKIVTFNNGFMYLKNLCTKITDGTHKTPDYKPEGIKFITAKNILEDRIDFEDVKYISKDEHNEISKRCKVEPGDMLFTKVGRIGYAKVVPANVPNFSIFVSVALLKLKGNVDSRFIEAFLNSKYGRIQSERLVKGSNQPDFHLEDIAEIKVPILSPEIQKYIGDKVREAEELREEAKKCKMKLENELKNLFNFKLKKSNIWYLSILDLEDRIDCEYNYKHFYQIKDNFEKRGLKVVKFGELIKKKLSEPQTNSEDFVSDGIPVLRITDIYEDYLDFENCAKIPEEIYEKLKEFQLIPNDIIFGLSGTIGRAIVVPDNIPNKAITNRRIAKVTLKDPQLAYYIAAFLNSEFGKIQLLRETTGGVQKNLRLEDITKIYIPIPSKELINKLSSIVKAKIKNLNDSRILIQEAKKDVEDLIEGNFDMSKVKANN